MRHEHLFRWVSNRRSSRRKEKAAEELSRLRAENQRYREELDQGIEDALEAIGQLVQETDQDIKLYRGNSASLLLWGRISYALTFVFAIVISWYFGYKEPILTQH